jgi:hypothetical protein
VKLARAPRSAPFACEPSPGYWRFSSAWRCSAHRGGRRHCRRAAIVGNRAGHVFAALPESWQRLRALSFALFMGTFGLVCAALALTPLHPAAEGTLTMGGIAGFAGSAPMPWCTRIVARFFAIVCLGAAALGVGVWCASFSGEGRSRRRSAGIATWLHAAISERGSAAPRRSTPERLSASAHCCGAG